MTITNPNAFIADTANWVHSTFAVSVGESYQNYLQILTTVNQTEEYANNGREGLSPVMSQVLSTVSDGDGGLSPVYFTKMKCRDTSLGGNDAINCLWQFNEDDDIAHAFTLAHINGTVGMGRVYSEIFDDQQQIMYLSFGTPVFNSLSAFYAGAYNTPMADLMNNGPEGMNFAEVLGTLLGKGLSTLLTLPAIPLVVLDYVLSATEAPPVTKYYDFKPQMPMYYRFVNTILTQLSLNMGIMDSSSYGNTSIASSTSITGSVTDSTMNYKTLLSTASDDGLAAPDYLQGSPDMLKILSKKTWYDKGQIGYGNVSTDEVLSAQTQFTSGAMTYSGYTGVTSSDDSSSADDASGILNRIWSSVIAFKNAYGLSITDSILYIGFRVEKGVDTSETINNQTGPAPIKEQINSKMQSARNINFGLAGGNISDGTIGTIISSAMSGVSSFIKGAMHEIGLSGINALAVGAGMIDIPDVWTDSSFSKNYSFNMALRAPYGDPLTVLQSEYIPLACLLAGALPRAVGQNSYTSPFLCRAYCKGMFAVPLGIIDGVNIRRGGDIHGWNNMRLPTQIDVSFTIKDLSPSMYMGIAGVNSVGDIGTALKNIVGADSTFNQYLATLSGMGVMEQTSPLINMWKRRQVLQSALFKDLLNPTYWGWAWGQRSPMRYITNILPVQKYIPQ